MAVAGPVDPLDTGSATTSLPQVHRTGFTCKGWHDTAKAMNVSYHTARFGSSLGLAVSG